MDNLAHVEQSLTDARDELVAYWEQPDGQACLLALHVATEALTEYQALGAGAARERNPAAWRRLDRLADEIVRLRTPLDTMT